MMKTEEYLKLLGRQIYDKEVRKEIIQELREHICDQAERYVKEGFTMESAYEKAVMEMGDPKEVGASMNKIHRKYIYWPMFFYYTVCTIICVLLRQLGMEYTAWSETAPVQIAFTLLGILMAVIGLCLGAYEKSHDLPLIYAYGKNWQGSPVSNSGLLLAIAVMGFGNNIPRAVLSFFICGALMLLEQAAVTKLKNKKEERVLWKTGISESEIIYKGYGTFQGERMKVAAKGENAIAKGSRIIICDMKGFTPVVREWKEGM